MRVTQRIAHRGVKGELLGICLELVIVAVLSSHCHLVLDKVIRRGRRHRLISTLEVLEGIGCLARTWHVF